VSSGVARVGFTGHQGLDAHTSALIEAALRRELTKFDPVVGFCSLAEGADQLFARSVVALGGRLNVVVPCREYRSTFHDDTSRAAYDELLRRAESRINLDYIEPSEQAFWAAGKRIVEEAGLLLAVWDGKPAGGLGGTADVVRFAREQGVTVTVLWPRGAVR
jgi:hypothetical protein